MSSQRQGATVRTVRYTIVRYFSYFFR